MKKGDKLRVTEKKYRKQEIVKVSQGEIVAINPGGITILKENGIRETFNIADLINKGQKKEVNEGDGWREIEGKKEGNRVVLFKKLKSNN